MRHFRHGYFLTATLLAAAALLPACGGGGNSAGADPGPNAPPPGPPAPIPNLTPLPAPTSLNCPSGTTLTYENFGQSYLMTYCTSCHSVQVTGSARNGAPAGVDFDTAIDVNIWRGNILKEATGANASMPPAANVGPADLSNFSNWLNCGAPSAAANSTLP